MTLLPTGVVDNRPPQPVVEYSITLTPCQDRTLMTVTARTWARGRSSTRMIDRGSTQLVTRADFAANPVLALREVLAAAAATLDAQGV